MADRTDHLREALYFALSGNYEIEAADYRRAAGLLVHLGWLPLADVLDALRDDDNALLAWHLSRNPDTYLDVAGVRYIADYLAERFATTAPEDPNADLR